MFTRTIGQPDSVLVAYLTVIAREPEAVSRALAIGGLNRGGAYPFA